MSTLFSACSNTVTCRFQVFPSMTATVGSSRSCQLEIIMTLIRDAWWDASHRRKKNRVRHMVDIIRKTMSLLYNFTQCSSFTRGLGPDSGTLCDSDTKKPESLMYVQS